MKIKKIKILGNGKKITMHLTEEWDKISFFENEEELDGEFLFEDSNEDQSVFLLRRMYSPYVYKRQGLGQAALEFFKQETNATIYTRENDGEVRDDGSNLTENAPSFVKKMQKIGLIEKWNDGE